MPDINHESQFASVDEEELFPHGYCTRMNVDGTMCDKPAGHLGSHRRRPLYDEHPVMEWDDEVGNDA